MIPKEKIDFFQGADLQQEPKKRPQGRLIPLWPQPFVEEPQAEEPKTLQTSKLPVALRNKLSIAEDAKIPWQLSPKTVAQTLVLVWVVVCLMVAGVNVGGFVMALKGMAVGLVCMIARPRGITHILVDQSGITLTIRSGASVLKTKCIPWFQIVSIYIEPAKNQNLLDAKLCISTIGSGIQSIKMSKFAEVPRWKAFASTVKAFSSTGARLDSQFLDPLCLEADQSFTRLWLDSLAAPPRRERMQPLTPGASLQNGRFSVIDQIGSGGQGNAYMASSADLGNIVLKEFVLPLYVDVAVRKQAITQFEREARLLASLHHPGIIRVYDTFVEDQRAYLVLERAGGASLKSLVETRGPLAEAEVISIGIQLCRILAYLHSQSPPLVHQDFTPDNLISSHGETSDSSDDGTRDDLSIPDGATQHDQINAGGRTPDNRINSGGEIKLIDFSGTRAMDGHATAVIGKRSYMPPEQFRGNPTTQSDIFALGCTLSYLLTGIEPEPISQAHPRDLNSSVSQRINAIVEKATSIRTEDRYVTAEDIAADLLALQGAPKVPSRSVH